MQRPVFITVRAPSIGGSAMKPQSQETPYIVKITNARTRGTYVPDTVLLDRCTGANNCTKVIPRTEMVHATRHWNNIGLRCRACVAANVQSLASGTGLIGWVHDSVGAGGYVSAQVAGIVEDESNASVYLQ
jgi:hypothetical protein